MAGFIRSAAVATLATMFVIGCSSDPAAERTSAPSTGVVASTGTSAPNREARSITLYEVAKVVAIADNTPLVFSPPPPRRLEQIPGPGDVLVLESDLFGAAAPRTANTATEPPAAIPGATLPEGDYQTFDPTGEKVGDLQGSCTFIRVVDQRPTFEDRTMVCTVALVLRDGNLTYAGILDVDALESAQPVVVPVVGGTGTYAGARGTITLQQPSRHAFDRFRVDIHLQS